MKTLFYTITKTPYLHYFLSFEGPEPETSCDIKETNGLIRPNLSICNKPGVLV